MLISLSRWQWWSLISYIHPDSRKNIPGLNVIVGPNDTRMFPKKGSLQVRNPRNSDQFNGPRSGKVPNRGAHFCS